MFASKVHGRFLAGLAAVIGATAFPVVAGAPGAPATPAPPGQTAGPVCEVGAHLADFYDLDPPNNNFSARVWVWSLCPDKSWDPLPNATFPNAYSPTISHSQLSFENGQYRDLELVESKFRQGIDEKDYPFDNQKLGIRLNTGLDISRLRLVADTRDSSKASGISLPGWRLTAFHVTSLIHKSTTNFGDRSLPTGVRRSSEMRLEIDLTRSDKLGFMKTTIPLIVIGLATAASLLIATRKADTLEVRLTALGALVFAVILNMQTADRIAPTAGISVIDQLHVLTLTWILVAGVVTAITFGWAKAADEGRASNERIKTFEYRSAAVGSLVWLGTGTLLVVTAASH